MATYFEDHAQKINQWSRTRRNGAKPSGVIVVHTAESATDFLGPDPGAEAVARYFATTDRYASYHHISDSDSSIQLAPWSAETWHDTGTNNHSVGISAAIRCADWKKLGARGELIVKRMAAGAAAYAKWLKQNYGITIPARKITRAQARAKVPGFLGHGTSDPGRRSDPGVDFDWALFFAEFSRLLGDVKPAVKPAAPAKPVPKPAPGKSVASMASEVIAGKHGTGHTARQRSLGVTAATYAQVRAEVNRRAGTKVPASAPAKPATKTVSQMATEVIQGKHGNGHDRRRKSLSIDAATYAKVRAEVNRRA